MSYVMYLKLKYGQLYDGSYPIELHSRTGSIHFSDTRGKIHPSMYKEIIKMMLNNFWIKKLNNKKYLMVYKNQGYIVDNNYNIKKTTWDYITDHISEDIIDEELPKL